MVSKLKKYHATFKIFNQAVKGRQKYPIPKSKVYCY